MSASPRSSVSVSPVPTRTHLYEVDLPSGAGYTLLSTKGVPSRTRSASGRSDFYVSTPRTTQSQRSASGQSSGGLTDATCAQTPPKSDAGKLAILGLYGEGTEHDQGLLVKACRKKISTMHLALIEKDAAIEGLEAKITELRGDVQTAKEMNRELRETLSAMEGKSEWWAKQRREFEAQKQRLMVEVEQEKNVNTEMGVKQALQEADAERRCNEMGSHLLEAEHAQEALSEQVNELKRKVHEKSVGNRALVETLNSIESKHRGVMTKAELEHMDMVGDLQNELTLKNEMTEQLRDANEKLNEEIRRYTGERETWGTRLQQVRSEYNVVEEEIRAEVATLREAVLGEKERRNADVRNYKRVLLEKERLLHGQTAAVKTLELQVEVLKGRREEVLDEVARLKTEVAVGECEVGRREAEMERAREEVRRAMLMVRGVEEEREGVEEEYKRVLKEKNSEIVSLKEDLERVHGLLPSHHLSPDTEDALLSRDHTLRSTLSHLLSDLLWLQTLPSSPTSLLVNPESPSEQLARTTDLPLTTLAARTQDAMTGFLNCIQSSQVAKHRDPSDPPDDCLIM